MDEKNDDVSLTHSAYPEDSFAYLSNGDIV